MPRRDDREAARPDHRDAPETDDTSEATRPPAEAAPGEGRSADGTAGGVAGAHGGEASGDDDDGLFGSEEEIERPPLEPERPSVENVLFVLAGALATVLLLLTTVY